eukprot:gene12726-6919_t
MTNVDLTSIKNLNTDDDFIPLNEEVENEPIENEQEEKQTRPPTLEEELNSYYNTPAYRSTYSTASTTSGIITGTFTGNRTQTLQDKDGTVACIDDIVLFNGGSSVGLSAASTVLGTFYGKTLTQFSIFANIDGGTDCEARIYDVVNAVNVCTIPMVGGVEIALLVISGINLITSFLSPLVVAGAYAIQNIKNSSCCGSSVTMRDDPIPIEQPKKEPSKDITDWEVFNENVMNKIKEKRRSQIEEMMEVSVPRLRNN